MRLNKTYLTIAIALFVIEVLIAVFFKSGFIRHTLGDFLVVNLIYSFVKSFIKIDSLILAIAALLFSFLIEFLQLANILKLLNLENNHLAKLILGSTFHLSDLIAYTMGIICILILETRLVRFIKPNRSH